MNKKYNMLIAANAAFKSGDYERAHNFYRRLMECDIPEAYVGLGLLFYHGLGVDINFEKSKAYYKSAIRLNSTEGSYYLGMLHKEMGNLKEALVNFESASSEGHLSSTYWAGKVCYLLRNENPKYIRNSVKYLKMAGDRGHVFAQGNLGRFLIKGSLGDRRLVRGVILWVSAVFNKYRVVFTEGINSDKLK